MIPSIWCRALVPGEEKHSIMNMIYLKNKPGNDFFYTKSVFYLKSPCMEILLVSTSTSFKSYTDDLMVDKVSFSPEQVFPSVFASLCDRSRPIMMTHLSVIID